MQPEVGMWHRSKVAALVVAVAAAGCWDGAVDPGDGGGGEEIAARFEQLADSVDGEGYSPTAEALRHAAEIVRLVGSATEVTLTIDGQARKFVAVGEQLDFPNIVCSWPGDTVVVPDDSVSGGPGAEPGAPGGGGGECEEVGTFSMRTLIAWEPDNLAEVVRLVADLGSTEVQPGVPDVMTGLPTGEAPADGDEPLPEPRDSAVGGYPGFIGEYLVRDEGSWWAVEGSQSNELVGSAGACTEDTVTFDWARFQCEGARFRFAVEMRVEAMRYDPATGWNPNQGPGAEGPEGSHDISLASTEIDGVRLEVVEWVPPPLPPPDSLPIDPPPVDPPPVDSTGVPSPG